MPSATRLLLLFTLLLGNVQLTSGQTREPMPETDTVFQVSFVPGVSNTDSRSSSVVSFNILGGYNGAFHGIEFGSVFNGNRYNVSGFQLSGVANVNEQEAFGAIVAGAFNYVQDFSGGLLSAGALNISRNSAGILLSGGVNLTKR